MVYHLFKQHAYMPRIYIYMLDKFVQEDIAGPPGRMGLPISVGQ
jgi:hypothetical protein